MEEQYQIDNQKIVIKDGETTIRIHEHVFNFPFHILEVGYFERHSTPEEPLVIIADLNYPQRMWLTNLKNMINLAKACKTSTQLNLF